MMYEYKESKYQAHMHLLTASNINLHDVPKAFMKNLDDSVRNAVKLGVEKPIRPIEYQWIARRGLLWLPHPQAYIMTGEEAELRVDGSNDWREGVAAIVWVDEPGGYRIASFGLGAWNEDILDRVLDESIVAINKQRDARQAIVDEMARQKALEDRDGQATSLISI